MENGLAVIERMNMIDTTVDIIPGKGAAGFTLGQRINDIKSLIPQLAEWIPENGKNLSEVISTTSGGLKVSVLHLSNGRREGEILYLQNGMVELHFNSEGVLFDISVFDGYSGALWGTIRIGSELSLVREWCEPVYDEGDEMHYPAEGSPVNGVAFYAEEESLAESPDQIIIGISVHDWSLSD